jgi:hypothetical protein
MSNLFLGYFKCPEGYVGFAPLRPLSAVQGFFKLGPDNIGYGRFSPQNDRPKGTVCDVMQDVRIEQGTVCLPFDADGVVDNLRQELYSSSTRDEESIAQSFMAPMYYWVRPLLPVAVRKHLQRVHLRGWDRSSFPRWSVEGEFR